MLGPSPIGIKLDEHYNKVASSRRSRYPSAAHGVRFERLETIVVCST
jgi:hypothetical protein